CPASFYFVKSPPPTVKIKGLQNNVEYILKVRPLHQSGKPGEWIPSFKLTPIPVKFPEDIYNGKGGDFSCQTSNASSLGFLVMILAFLMGLRLRRSFKLSIAPIALAIFFLIPEISHADFGNVNIGLLGAMYRPDLDSEKLSDGSAIFPIYR